MVVVCIVMFVIVGCQHSAQPVQDRYKKAIGLAGEWFLNNQNDAFLHYSYNPYEKRHSEDQHPLREMAAMWSITETADFTGDGRYDALARRGFEHFEKSLGYDTEYNFGYRGGADAILELQVRELGILDQQALGGFFGSDDSDSMRVDRNQHAVMALIEAYELGLLNNAR